VTPPPFILPSAPSTRAPPPSHLKRNFWTSRKL